MEVNMWYQQKALWLNVIAVIVLILQYLLNLPTNPATWVVWEGLAVIVLNAIAGMIQGQQVYTLKAKLKK
jgi:hypothetical protein